MGRWLGIDFGSKKIGLALSDESGTLAFPEEVFENNSGVLNKIKKILEIENIKGIVVGESLDHSGQSNKIMEEIKKFSTELEIFGLPIHFQKEFLTTMEARKLPGKRDVKHVRHTPHVQVRVDASAAALILQRFLDKNNKNG